MDNIIRIIERFFSFISSFVEQNRGNIVIDNKITDFIIKNSQEILVMVVNMPTIEKFLFLSLYLVPIPLTVEAYLIFRKFLFPKIKDKFSLYGGAMLYSVPVALYIKNKINKRK
jgi:hypothetical protein